MLSSTTLFQVAFRSFFLQASWNFRGMMSMGFLYSIKPGLDQIWDDGPQRQIAYRRHMEYFNTNPYFASIVMGVTLALEERVAKGEIGEEIIRDTKEGLMTALAALGDGFFWDSWRPFVAAFALIFAFNNYLFTPLLFLLIYNVPALVLRFRGVYWGYSLGPDVIRLLMHLQMSRIRLSLRYATLILLCYLVANHVTLHTPYLITNLPLEYFFFGEKILQGFGAALIVGLAAFAYRSRIDVLMISFLLMIVALLFYHWGVLI